MRAQTIPQTAQFTAFGSLTEPSRSVQSDSFAAILVPALWSGIGLALSALFVPWLNTAMEADDTFGFLIGMLG